MTTLTADEIRSRVETDWNRIVKVLEEHQVTLMKDIAMFDQMYELNAAVDLRQGHHRRTNEALR